MAWNSTRSTRQARGYGAEWQRTRLAILERDCYLCQCPECQAKGRVREAQEVDHIVPIAFGGTDEPSNLRAVNKQCHRRITIMQRGDKPKPRIGADGYPIR